MNSIIWIICLILPLIFLFLKTRGHKNLPPGKLGLPLVGQSISLLRAMRSNTAEKWLQDRIARYGPVSKLSLFGKPTVFIHGPAANRFLFSSDSSSMVNQQTKSIQKILGDRNLLELCGEDHKRVRGAFMPFLKPDSLKQYVQRMDHEIREHIAMHWQGKKQVKVLPLAKILTFNIICSLLFGLERGRRRDKFVEIFQEMIMGMWSVPIDLPFTRYRRSLIASAKAQAIIVELIKEKKLQVEQNGPSSSRQDLITHLLSVRDEDGKEMLSEAEIAHNVMLVMIAGHDTSAVVITFIMRAMATEMAVYEAVLQEQEAIARVKGTGEALRWEDLAKMKYTWRVAMEVLRMYPPVFGGFRRAVKDIHYNGYIIPKDWQIFWETSKTHMDASIFPDPEKFSPERFENQASIPPYSYIPFGGGPRICPGNEFAKVEILSTIHHLVTKFTWKLSSPDISYKRDPMPEPHQGLSLYIFPKQSQ
uniref:Cytochrome P450 n=1 Tax=Kalanchoe fedtschenkoi TaxID=63787 RepID=A0A7N0RB40_KALFE